MEFFKSAKGNLYLKRKGDAKALRFMPSVEDVKKAGAEWKSMVQVRDTDYGQVYVLVSELEVFDMEAALSLETSDVPF